jgi:hypothetical protein
VKVTSGRYIYRQISFYTNIMFLKSGTQIKHKIPIQLVYFLITDNLILHSVITVPLLDIWMQSIYVLYTERERVRACIYIYTDPTDFYKVHIHFYTLPAVG